MSELHLNLPIASLVETKKKRRYNINYVILVIIRSNSQNNYLRFELIFIHDCNQRKYCVTKLKNVTHFKT